MSSMTPCNRCQLKRLIQKYSSKEGELVMTPGDFGLGGVNYHFVRPGEDGPSEDNFIAWFMEISNHCVC